ncbi:Processing alpha glucosidase I [Haplosporangium gracile]|nr:Processing alpha glucosidase I [Haplosporangium gracile]
MDNTQGRSKARTRTRRTGLISLALTIPTTACLLASSSFSIVVNADSSFIDTMHSDPATTAAVAQNSSLLWGIYRPNLYFGTRARLPNTLMTGLMWFGTQDFSGPDHIRHGCEERDGFEKYGWLKHDGRTFGIQELKDTRNNVELTTEFIKVPGGNHGGSWGARISGKPIRKGKPMSISTLYYIGLDGDGQLNVDTASYDVKAPIVGNAKGLGDFDITIQQIFGHEKTNTHYMGAAIPSGSLWRAKEFAKKTLTQRAQIMQQQGATDFRPQDLYILPDQFFGSSTNILLIQMNYDSEFEFEVRFNSKSSSNPVTTGTISSAISKAENAFDERFEDTFHLKQRGYSDSMVNFAKATMSNLVGGIGYFHGSSIVDESPTYEDGQNDHLEGPVARRPSPDPQMTAPASLFSAVPSRSFFPRGFYWDEGFHQTLLGQWDNDLSLEVIKSWYDRQDSNGWIQREQILGEEARSRVPEQFQIQYPEHANPPTLLYAISGYLDRLSNFTNTFSVGAFGNAAQTQFSSDFAEGEHDVLNARLADTDLAKQYLAELYPKLRINYEWMRRTMQGGIREYGRTSHSRVEGYRWRGRTKSHTLTSGLDDYPRAELPSVAELHVDLLSWIGFMSRNLQRIANIVGEEDDAEEFEGHYNAIVNNVEDLHWNEEQKAYCDVTVDEMDESVQVCHKGYVTLFPVLLGIISPESKNLDHILDLMHDPNELWTPYGLRSLSASDERFGTGENYWKGPIWINVNYLALHALKTHYVDKGPYREKAAKIYNELRDNLIKNIYSEYERTGYVWEQYNDKTGHGQRSHPFTGWTAMIVLIMQMGRA